MFRNYQLDRLRKAFADQFSGDERGFIYRKFQKGAPIRVSEMERDEFISTFNKRTRLAMWSIFPATIGLILLLAWLIPDDDSTGAYLAMWLGLAAIMVPFLTIFYWAWNAPSRQLKSRTPVGVALTKEEARALAWSKISYSQLTLAALMGAGLVWKKSMDINAFHGFGIIWLLFGTALIVFAGVQAIRKWRFSQQ